MWQQMREAVIDNFPAAPGLPINVTAYLKKMDGIYTTDAYHSLLMNLMLATGGYPWTVVPVERRRDYMAALKEASVRQNIVPFTCFIAHLISLSLDGHAIAKLPD